MWLVSLRTNLLIWVIFIAGVAADPPQTIKPDCQYKCGNVSIPDHFGTREGCYLNSNFFLITCNTSFSPPKPHAVTAELKCWSPQHFFRGPFNHLYIYVAVDYYSETGKLENSLFSLSITPFLFSVTRNKFIGIGCDTFAFIEDHNSNSIEKNYHTGCLSLYTSTGSVSNGSCSGIGCWKTLIPKRMYHYNARVESFHNHTGIWGFNPCSILFWWKKTLMISPRLILLIFGIEARFSQFLIGELGTKHVKKRKMLW